MLIIEVTNSRDLVRQRIGRLGERLIGRVVDAEAQVEKALIQELETAFKEFGIEARIVSVQGPQLCLLYTSPSPRDLSTSRMPSSA